MNLPLHSPPDEASTRRRRPRVSTQQTAANDGQYKDDLAGVVHTTKQLIRKKKQQRRPSQHADDDCDDQPFHVLFLQVAATLFSVCFITLYLWRRVAYPNDSPLRMLGTQPEDTSTYDDDDTYSSTRVSEELEEVAAMLMPTPSPTRRTAPPLPVWELGPATDLDAFGIAQSYMDFLASKQQQPAKNNRAFWATAESLRTEFAGVYGGENAARAMMERGLSTFGSSSSDSNRLPSDLVATACRIRNAKDEQRPFSMVFGGYSVTVGRGNYFSQSFPFVMHDILETSFQLLGMDLSVKNAAIGGCPSFPYGFCMSNFWGKSADVVSWDYSMNEAGGVPEGLEAYLRHTMTLSHKPKLIVKDTHMADRRRDLLQQYSKLLHGEMFDPIVLHTDPAVRPFLERDEDFRPEGFQQWRKFGSPPGAPGQALHHPAVKEHQFLGWMLAMHFLSALELLAAASEYSPQHQFTCPSLEDTRKARFQQHRLPPPVTTNMTDMKPWSSILFGVPVAEKQESTADPNAVYRGPTWRMNPVHCKTSFQPIVNKGVGDLTSIVVSGSLGEDMDLMLPKGHMFYNQGWVFDLSEGEKEAKRKLDRFGGLGFVDSKQAYRGLFSSGALRLLVPYYSNDDKRDSMRVPNVGDNARDWFQTLVLCEVNERREAGACQPKSDVTYLVGGVKATAVTVMDDPGILYLGKKICVQVPVPEGATLTTRADMLLTESTSQKSGMREKKPNVEEKDKTTLGLPLELSVDNHLIIARESACSLSHVVWEQRSPEDPPFPPRIAKEAEDAPTEEQETATQVAAADESTGNGGGQQSSHGSNSQPKKKRDNAEAAEKTNREAGHKFTTKRSVDLSQESAVGVKTSRQL